VDSDDARQADLLAQEYLSVFEPGLDPNVVEELAEARYRDKWAWAYGQLTDRAWEIFRAWRYAREAEDAGA
jgi:hypothetical protein